MTRIVLADDHPLFLTALVDALTRAFDDVEIFPCRSVSEVLEKVVSEKINPDLVLLDLDMPGVDGQAGLAMLQDAFPLLPVAILSATGDSTKIRQLLATGAAGFLLKSMELADLILAIESLLEGNTWIPDEIFYHENQQAKASVAELEMERRFASLSPQQRKILTMMVEGRLNKEIAYSLGLSEQTVKLYASVIFKKLGVTNRTQAAVAVAKQNMK